MPTRYLKPGICDSALIDRASPMAETLWYRLLVNVDDFGRIDARPAVIRSKCYPLKDELTNAKTLELLIELQTCGLIFIYESNGCSYLQMQKWDNVPRAKESKCPSYDDTCAQLYATVCNGNTVLPVTGTGTGTDKPELKQKTGTGTVPARKKRADPKTPDPDELQSACRETWKSYSEAYFARYETEPVRNATVNTQVKSFVKRIGAEESPHVAAFFVQSNSAFYVQRGHIFGNLLADAEKLRTEWATGRTMTGTRARQIDQSQANFSVVGEALKILEAQNATKTS